MVTFLSFLVVGLLCLTLIACGRITRLGKDLNFWRQEAMKLNSEKPKRDSKGRYCKRKEKR